MNAATEPARLNYIHLDLNAGVVALGDRRAKLTVRAAQMFATIAAAHGRFVSRDEIDAAFNRGRPISDAGGTIRVAIHLVRAAFEKGGVPDVIETDLCRGWRVTVPVVVTR